MTTVQTAWSVHDYVSPGLRVVHPDDCFPDLQPGDQLRHPWKYLRRDVPHTWYVHGQFPHMGVLSRDEAVLLHNLALQFAGRHALEIGSWLGWSTCHLALAGVSVDAIDPAHEDPEFRAHVEASLDACGVTDRVRLVGGSSPGAVADLAVREGRRWSLFFVDGDHEGRAPARDALACLPYATGDCAFVFHDLASPDVAAGLRAMQDAGLNVALYQTAQIMGLAWRGDVTPVAHVPDPAVAWQVPSHLVGLPIVGLDFEPAPCAAGKQLVSLRRPDAIPARPSVCIVSNEIVGPHRNGGIGTAMTGVAECLADDGYDVTVLYTGNVLTPDVDLSDWRSHFEQRGIDLVTLDFVDMGEVVGPMRDVGFATPALVYRYLAEHRFDVVHFNDCCADGSLSLAAKRLRLAFQQTLFVVGLHSPSQWVLRLNDELPTSLLLAAFNFAERLSVRCADVLWSPSRYMLDWARDHDFELPEASFVQQYSIPTPAAGSFPDVKYGPTDPPREIVFFGRLEDRKGLRLFCNAVALLSDDLADRGVAVTFLGKPATCDGLSSAEYIGRRSAQWRCPVEVVTDLGQPEALAYLRADGRLAVIPSPVDNSPCTVYEALCWGIPFLATRTGGIPELVDAADQQRVLFDPTTPSLCAAVRAVLDDGGWLARPAVPQAEGRRGLLALHDRWHEFLPEPSDRLAPSRWAAAVVDHRDGDDLALTLASLAACPWISTVVVLDRSGRATGRGVRTIDLTREDADAAARQLLGVDEAAVLLIHSGVELLAEPFGAMLGALDAVPVDGLIPGAAVTDRRGQTRFAPPLGGSTAFSLFEGVTFTGAMLVGRDALPAVHGAQLAAESPFLGLADFCVAGGAEVWPYPDAVVRQPHGLVLDVRSPLPARIAAYDAASPVDRYYMLATGYGARAGLHRVAPRRELALALVDRGFAPAVRAAAWAVGHARRARGRLEAFAATRRPRGGRRPG